VFGTVPPPPEQAAIPIAHTMEQTKVRCRDEIIAALIPLRFSEYLIAA
jgi:hypothetical protein